MSFQVSFQSKAGFTHVTFEGFLRSTGTHSMYIRTSTTINPLIRYLYQRELNKHHIGCVYPARMSAYCAVAVNMWWRSWYFYNICECNIITGNNKCSTTLRNDQSTTGTMKLLQPKPGSKALHTKHVEDVVLYVSDFQLGLIWKKTNIDEM